MRSTKKSVSRLLAVVAFAALAGSASAQSKLIDSLPDDMVAAIYVARPQHALPPSLTQPFFEALTENKQTAVQMTAALKKLTGPILLGMLMPQPGKDEPDFFFTLELTGPPVDFDELVEKTFLPTLAAIAELPEGQSVKLDKGKNGSRIVQEPGDKTILTYAIKDKIVVGSSRPQLSLRWARGEWPEARWIDLPGVKKLLRKLPKNSSLRILFNPVPLIKAIPKPAPNSAEELGLKICAPEDCLAGAADLTWQKSMLSARFTVALADECHGLARVLARPTTPARVLGVFPEDFLALGRIGWGSASDVVDGAYHLTDQFDESISAEYRQELAEFRQETGVDWDTGILGNMVGELAFGVRVDFTKRPPVAWAVVAPLGEEARFREQFDKLIAFFGLPFEDSEKDGVLIHKAALGPPEEDAGPPEAANPFAGGINLAIQNGLLIAGGDVNTVVEIAQRAAAEKKPEPAGANLRLCYQELGDPNHMAAMIDIEQLYQKVPLMAVAAGPQWAPFISEGFGGLALTVEEQVARLDVRWSLKSPGAAKKADSPKAKEPQAAQALVFVTRALSASLAEARKEARRTVSMVNMRGIGMAMFQYAEAHKGAFPDSLVDLIRSESITIKMLVSPYDGRGPKTIDEIASKSYVIYRPGLTQAGGGAIAMEPILVERELHDNGVCVLFADGHVEWAEGARASEIIEQVKAAAAGPRK